MSQVYATPRKGKDFGKGVAAAKKAGGKFNGSCWEIPAANIARFKCEDDSEDDYLRRNYLVRVGGPEKATWTPAAMDAETSPF